LSRTDTFGLWPSDGVVPQAGVPFVRAVCGCSLWWSSLVWFNSFLDDEAGEHSGRLGEVLLDDGVVVDSRHMEAAAVPQALVALCIGRFVLCRAIRFIARLAVQRLDGVHFDPPFAVRQYEAIWPSLGLPL